MPLPARCCGKQNFMSLIPIGSIYEGAEIGSVIVDKLASKPHHRWLATPVVTVLATTAPSQMPIAGLNFDWNYYVYISPMTQFDAVAAQRLNSFSA